MQQIGRYQIVGELGRGAMGVVYRALDPAIGRTIAIKTIRLSDLTEPSERQRLRDRLVREAQSAGVLSHPGIVTIYDIQEEGGMAYIFMEYVNGPPLEKLLSSEKTLDNETILALLEQTAAALDYAHRKGIVHRDIKPANIMIHDDGAAKITDFGVAKILSQQITQIGAIMGTPGYMSPEQVQGRAVDGRADQFALAVIAYELLTGEKPFISDYLPTLLYKIVSEEPIAPQRLNPSLGSKVEVVFRKAMSKDPAARYETCTAFVTELAEACNSKRGWRALPRGASNSLPTVSTGSKDGVAGEGAQPSLTVTLPPPRKPRRTGDEPQKRSALTTVLRVVGGFAMGVILVGALFLGAQKWLGIGGARVDVPKQAAKEPTPQPPPSPQPKVQAPPSPPQPTPAPAVAPVEKSDPQPQLKSGPPPSPKPPAPSDVIVELGSTPPGATLVFDGNAGITCTAPCTLSLSSGRHALAATLPGYRTAFKIFEAPSMVPVWVMLDRMTAVLAVKSTPSGAAIFVDGHEQAQKTPALLNLPVGAHRIRLIKEGLPPYEEDVEIKENSNPNMTVTWK